MRKRVKNAFVQPTGATQIDDTTLSGISAFVERAEPTPKGWWLADNMRYAPSFAREEKPCDLTKPRFGYGRKKNGELLIYPISEGACTSGRPAVKTQMKNGKTWHLCAGCSLPDWA